MTISFEENPPWIHICPVKIHLGPVIEKVNQSTVNSPLTLSKLTIWSVFPHLCSMTSHSSPTLIDTNRCPDCVTLSLTHRHIVQVLALIKYICVSFETIPWHLNIHPYLPICSPKCTGDSQQNIKRSILFKNSRCPQLSKHDKPKHNCNCTYYTFLSTIQGRSGCLERRVWSPGWCNLVMNKKERSINGVIQFL